MKCYPIKCLHSEVSKVFATLKGVDFKNAIDNGFINTIFETDTEGKIGDLCLKLLIYTKLPTY